MALIEHYQQRDLTFCQGYGMTEASPGATVLDAAQTAGRAGSAGPPVFFCDIRVARSDRSDATVGEPGEVLIKGPNITPGYWKNPDATAEAITDGGWLHSGDVGTLDDEGHLHIVDRIKDMFISGSRPAGKICPPHVRSTRVLRSTELSAGRLSHPRKRGRVQRSRFEDPYQGLRIALPILLFKLIIVLSLNPRRMLDEVQARRAAATAAECGVRNGHGRARALG